MLEFYRGGTICFEFKVKNPDAPYALTDPSVGCVLDIWGPDEEEILVGGSMTKDETGVYYYKWTSDKNYEAGIYTARAFAKDGSPVELSVDEYQFQLK